MSEEKYFLSSKDTNPYFKYFVIIAAITLCGICLFVGSFFSFLFIPMLITAIAIVLLGIGLIVIPKMSKKIKFNQLKDKISQLVKAISVERSLFYVKNTWNDGIIKNFLDELKILVKACEQEGIEEIEVLYCQIVVSLNNQRRSFYLTGDPYSERGNISQQDLDRQILFLDCFLTSVEDVLNWAEENQQFPSENLLENLESHSNLHKITLMEIINHPIIVIPQEDTEKYSLGILPICELVNVTLKLLGWPKELLREIKSTLERLVEEDLKSCATRCCRIPQKVDLKAEDKFNRAKEEWRTYIKKLDEHLNNLDKKAIPPEESFLEKNQQETLQILDLSLKDEIQKIHQFDSVFYPSDSKEKFEKELTNYFLDYWDMTLSPHGGCLYWRSGISSKTGKETIEYKIKLINEVLGGGFFCTSFRDSYSICLREENFKNCLDKAKQHQKSLELLDKPISQEKPPSFEEKHSNLKKLKDYFRSQWNLYRVCIDSEGNVFISMHSHLSAKNFAQLFDKEEFKGSNVTKILVKKCGKSDFEDYWLSIESQSVQLILEKIDEQEEAKRKNSFWPF